MQLTSPVQNRIQCVMKEVLRYPNCFVCGDLNPGGLKAKFFFDGQKAYTEITTDSRFEGYKGIYHGGVLSSLLDEIMIKAILANERFAVTAEMTVRFLLPVKIGEKLSITGSLGGSTIGPSYGFSNGPSQNPS